jgi:DNA-binding NtrC family response regulator
VLIVDDDVDLCAVLIELLQTHGLAAESATSVTDGLAALDRSGFALVILDWFLPDGTAADLLASARQRGIPVVLSSASIETSDRACELGALAALPKPFDVERLFQTIDRVLAEADAAAPDYR